MVTFKQGAKIAPAEVEVEDIAFELEFFTEVIGLVRQQAELYAEGWEPEFPGQEEPDHLRLSFEDTKWMFSLITPPGQTTKLFSLIHFTIFNCYESES